MVPRPHATRTHSLFCALALALPAAAQDVPAVGFDLLPEAVPLTGTSWVGATFENGDVLVFDGVNVERYNAGGGFLQTLETLPAFVFPSFVEIAPDETFAVVGESSNGELLRIDLLLGGSTPLGSLAFNFDAAFEDGGHLVVSAATGGFGADNELWRVDVTTGAAVRIGSVPGASGPVALDDEGNLYYGTTSNDFPPPAAQTDLLRWDASVIGAGVPFDASDATVLSTGLAGASSLVFDDVLDALYVAEVNFGTGASRISRLPAGTSIPQVLVEGRPFFAISRLELAASTSPAVFAPYQPAHGATLRYQTTDFLSDVERLSVVPLRATLVLSGPGTSAPGPFDATLSGGPPGGFAVVAHGPASSYDPAETAYFFTAPPLFLGLAPGSMSIHPTPFLLDSQGGFSQSFVNPGTLFGQAAQVVLFHADLSFAGTSAAAFL